MCKNCNFCKCGFWFVGILFILLIEKINEFNFFFFNYYEDCGYKGCQRSLLINDKYVNSNFNIILNHLKY